MSTKLKDNFYTFLYYKKIHDFFYKYAKKSFISLTAKNIKDIKMCLTSITSWFIIRLNKNQLVNYEFLTTSLNLKQFTFYFYNN